MPANGREQSSFRDPCGFIFYYNDSVYRQIDERYRENYECFIKSGLYKHLVEEDLILPHTETDLKSESSGFIQFYKRDIVKLLPDYFRLYKTIKPEKAPTAAKINPPANPPLAS